MTYTTPTLISNGDVVSRTLLPQKSFGNESISVTKRNPAQSVGFGL